MDSMTCNAKWTSPRAAQWVPTISTLPSPASSSSFDTTPRYMQQHRHYQSHHAVESRMVAAVDPLSMQSVDVFDQLQAQPERKKTNLSATVHALFVTKLSSHAPVHFVVTNILSF